MHSVAVVAFDGVVPFDLSVPCEIFGRAQLADGTPAYEVGVCGPNRPVNAGLFALRPRWPLDTIERAHTVIVPGVSHLDAPISAELRRALRSAADRGARIASICTGAFVLAGTGLLDGKRATTHWAAAAELSRRYPSLTVDPDVLYVDEGQLLTSAGAAAGLDLCLHLVRRDFGAAVAAHTARLSVMPLEREGGQAQFIEHQATPDDGTSLAPLLRWLGKNLSQELTLSTIARKAAMSPRSLSRHFHQQTGETPAQWVLAARVRWAQRLLETTNHPVERVAEQVGFGSPATFRERFHRLVGTSPQAWRRSFRARALR
jgi:transcriptional regulator GlxA family with amidase domain